MNKKSRIIIIGFLVSMFLSLYFFTELQNATIFQNKNTEKEVCTPVQYVKWVEEKASDLNKQREMEDFNFTLSYLPAEYLYSRQVVMNERLKMTDKISLDDFTGTLCFNYKIGTKTGTGEVIREELNSVNQYQQRIQYYAFDFKDDVQLIQKGDTIKCEMAHFERGFDASPVSNIMIGFPSDAIDKESDFQIVVHDKVFDKGIFKFHFGPDTFNSYPKLATL